MSDFENPTPRKGEKQKDFVSRCIPIVKSEHPDWKPDRVAAACYSMYRRKHKNMEKEGYELFTSSAEFRTIKNDNLLCESNNEQLNQQDGATHLIAIIGDRFMNGGFFSFAELRKCYKEWEGTLHDINHMGTSTGWFMSQQDIRYFIGYHKNVKLDEKTKSVSMDLELEPTVKLAEDWQAFIKLNEKANQIPNVSVTYWGKRKFILASELPKEADWAAVGFNKDDLVPVLYDVHPVCVSTVFRGRCGDKDGCGIRTDNDSCSCDSCNSEIEKERQELIKRIKLKEKELSED